MKKLIAIFLLVVYTGSAYGITISRHYCESKPVGSPVLGFVKATACCSGEPGTPADCCSNEIKKFDTDDHSPASVLDYDSRLDISICFFPFNLNPGFYNQSSFKSQIQSTLDHNHWLTPPIYLFIGIFRI